MAASSRARAELRPGSGRELLRQGKPASAILSPGSYGRGVPASAELRPGSGPDRLTRGEATAGECPRVRSSGRGVTVLSRLTRGEATAGECPPVRSYGQGVSRTAELRLGNARQCGATAGEWPRTRSYGRVVAPTRGATAGECPRVRSYGRGVAPTAQLRLGNARECGFSSPRARARPWRPLPGLTRAPPPPR